MTVGVVDCPTQLTLVTSICELICVQRQIPVRNMKEHIMLLARKSATAPLNTCQICVHSLVNLCLFNGCYKM